MIWEHLLHWHAPLTRFLQQLMYTRVDISKTVVVCHSEAGAWYPPLYETSVCPPSGARYVVGRTMVRLDAFFVPPPHVLFTLTPHNTCSSRPIVFHLAGPNAATAVRLPSHFTLS